MQGWFDIQKSISVIPTKQTEEEKSYEHINCYIIAFDKM